MNHVDRPVRQPYRPLDSDPALSPTLLGYLYSDPAVFEAEKRQIFYQSWHLVSHRTALKEPGDYVTSRIVGQKVFLLRGDDGQIRGFFNVCQHRAHQLLKGKGNTRTAIVCPYHAWIYDLDGGLRTARATNRMDGFNPAEYGLKPIRVEERLGFLFANLDPDAPSIDETHGDMLADMKADMPWVEQLEMVSGGQADLDIFRTSPFNWKVLAENCLECYHCGPAHKAFVDLVDIGTYVCTVHGNWTKSAASALNLKSQAYTVAEDAPVKINNYWHMFPSTEFGLFPGSRTLNAFRFLPTGPESTDFMSMTLVVPGDPLPSERIEYVRNVLWPEDEGICLSVHDGLKSLGYRQGRFGIDPKQPGLSENAVHGFQRRYAKAMGL